MRDGIQMFLIRGENVNRVKNSAMKTSEAQTSRSVRAHSAPASFPAWEAY